MLKTVELKIAAIDIGSNAVRCQISNVLKLDGRIFFKKVEYIRYALRLGEDVFQTGRISDAKLDKFFKLLQSLQLLMDVHDVADFMVVATSAMREAQNAHAFVQEVQNRLGMTINIIHGEEEAYLVNKVIINELDERNYLHIDVGGGSTELNVYVNREKIASESFEVGSIRSIKGNETAEIRQAMKNWVREHTERFEFYRAVGTGGNIGKLYELSRRPAGMALSRGKLEELATYIADMSMQDRINKLLLNPDRADVIVPASQIYLSVMKWAKIRSIQVPNVGLKDGMMLKLYENMTHRDINQNEPVGVGQEDVFE